MSEVSRPLLTAGEVTRMAEDTMLVLSGNRQPMLVKQQRWYQHRRLRRLGKLRHTASPLPDQQAPTAGADRSLSLAVEHPVRGTERLDTAALVAPVVSGGAPVQDDGAICLDHNLQAGESTWVEALEDLDVPTPVPDPVTSSSATTSGFDVLQDA